MRSAACRCKPLSPQSTKPKVKWLALHACMPLMIWINLCVRVCILSRSSNETEKRRAKLMTALLFASLRVPGRWFSKNGLYPCERSVEPAAVHAQYTKDALTGSIIKQTARLAGIYIWRQWKDDICMQKWCWQGSERVFHTCFLPVLF